jgi:hypothetical protein
MSRAQKNTRRGKGKSASVQRQPAATGEGKGAGVTKRTGTERPDASTNYHADMADPTPRVIKTN